MSLELYPHNKKALDAAYALWATGEHYAAIVHAVGTGKSFIYHRLAQDRITERTLVCAPTNYIFTVQREAVEKVCPDYDFDSAYETITYTMLYNLAKVGILKPNQYDIIVLDEFHRCGAKKWSQGVKMLLELNPNADVLGLSATPERGDGIDMAQTLFKGNVVSLIDLAEAMARELVPVPMYFIGKINASELKELEKFENSIADLTDPTKKEKAEKLLAEYRRAIATSAEDEDLANLFKRNLKKKSAKLIIFCRNRTDLKLAEKNAQEWFGEINSNIHVYRIYTGNKANEDDWYTGSNVEQLQAFNADNSRALKLLYCINMANEGIHVEGIDGVVMMRPTCSRILYKQQLGRAITVDGNKKPLIFDLVGNMEATDACYEFFNEYQAARKRLGKSQTYETEFFHLTAERVSRNRLEAALKEMCYRPLTIEEKVAIVVADLEQKKARL